jgi:hypothetical protein
LQSRRSKQTSIGIKRQTWFVLLAFSPLAVNTVYGRYLFRLLAWVALVYEAYLRGLLDNYLRLLA